MTNHTIILIQPNSAPSSRTYYDNETVADAMDQIASLYEQELQRQNPRAGQIQYRAEDLFRFIDTYKEFVALVFDPTTRSYQPRDKEWIKSTLLNHFSRQNAAAAPPPRNSYSHQGRYRRR
ncbi:enhancer of rudimentary [Radiomyces spectabilis]|uniref:enhancer of rudimentary n=1 Tax=Radiomyces spectabilis TaxID=64574 RepID=UPI00222102F7|nr:enhancer of rudimentary [Radiomyces spectabilis]KAI8377559.1 enhancer of rudimentary [Radiomyces spectabilis]